jgi:hypothetical protein
LPDFLIDIEGICKHFPEYNKDDIVQSIEYIKTTLSKNKKNIGTSFYMKFDKHNNPVYKQSRKGIARNYYVNRKKPPAVK